MANISSHIAYFSNQFVMLNGTGITRYSRELYQALVDLDSAVKITPVASWSSLSTADTHAMQTDTGLKLLPWGKRWTPLAWTFLNRPPIEHWLDESVDLVHSLSLGYPVATRKPYVVTIHDIGVLVRPEFFSNNSSWLMKRTLKHALKNADALICVSLATADDLESYIGYGLGDRLHVVHEGVSPRFFDEINSQCLAGLSDLPMSDTPFILAAGKISPRKNILGIIKALAKISDKIPHHLVLVGGSGWDLDDIQKAIKSPEVKNRIHFTGFVTDEQLRALYSCSSLYVHPSLYEGFGLTVLEAMAAGCPVVTSNFSSLPEVAGDAALLVDPYNVDEIAGAIESICLDEQLAASLIRRGTKRASGFTWQRCAEQIADIYRKVA